MRGIEQQGFNILERFHWEKPTETANRFINRPTEMP